MSRMTAAEFQALGAKRMADITPAQIMRVVGQPIKPMHSARAVEKARGLMPNEAEGMNGLEARYQKHLALRKAAGEVVWYRFSPFKLRLAPKTYYTPDFAVITADCGLEFHETKGFMRDDAAVKIKVAAALYRPFRFKLIRWIQGDWVITDVP